MHSGKKGIEKHDMIIQNPSGMGLQSHALISKRGNNDRSNEYD